MPALQPAEFLPALQRAERCIFEGRFRAALEQLAPAVASDAGNYWVNFLASTALAGIGETRAAEEALLRAIASDDPSRVGAIFQLLKLDLSRGAFDRVALLDDAIRLCDHTDQKRWYYAQLMLLRAMTHIRQGGIGEAERVLAAAYDFRLDLDELELTSDWVRDVLARLMPQENRPNLEFLRQRVLNLHQHFSYDEELHKIPDGATVLEIGAMDGVRFDPLRRHIITRDWDAILLEPLPDMFELLCRNYKGYPNVRCVNVAIAEKTGPLTLYRVTPEAVSRHGHGEWLIGVSSAFKTSHLKFYESIVSEEVVDAISFSDLVEAHRLDKIDVLQIDTEGCDLAILNQIDLERWNICLIRIEILNLKPADRLRVFEILRCAGYDFDYDGMDVTAVRRPRPARSRCITTGRPAQT